MATDNYFLERLRNILLDRRVTWIEKKMFGGHCFMVDDKMCFGTFRGGLMTRLDPDKTEEYLEREFTEPMRQKDRPMKGYIFIHPEGYDTEEDLEFWIDQCLKWNPFAKSSKKSRK